MPRDSAWPPFLPMTRQEMKERGWSELDIIFVTGDAYIDHPSFAPALLGRWLESHGFRVGIIARPRPDSPDDLKSLGPPNLFFAVSPGAVDSMINNYTAQKRRRRTDAYAPGGQGGGRPNRAAIVYCNMIRQVFGKSVGIVAGGIEVSLRRLAHYDFWDDAVRRSIMLDAPADVMIYGMGERPLLELALAMKSRMAKEGSSPCEVLSELASRIRGVIRRGPASACPPKGYHVLPSFEEVRDRLESQVEAWQEEVHFRATGVYQDCAGHRVIVNPPPDPLSRKEMDAVYDLPFTRRAHPSYRERVPALEQVQFSVTSHRGCFGGCTFCGISTHQGKRVQSRSRESILSEVKRMVGHPDFKGTIRDIGGATANMWGLDCEAPDECDRPSCLAPKICKKLNTDQRPYLSLLEEARKIKGVKHLFISSGVRMDLALLCKPFIEAFAGHYTSGHAKVAPEHIVAHVLRVMMKPGGGVFLEFLKQFRRASERARKKQYVLPYFIAAHPGSRIEDMIEVALFLKRENLRVEQCQIFTPIPGTAGAVMYATGINPFDNKSVYVERNIRRREMQKALVLWHSPGNAKRIRSALEECGRTDLIKELAVEPARSKRKTQGTRARARIGSRTRT